MRTILRSGPLVDAWFDMLRPEQQDLARTLREIIVAAAPTLAMSIKWGNLMFTREGTHALAIVMHKDHGNLQVFNGALLIDRFPELEGTGKSLRHLRFRFRQPVDEDLVRAAVLACLEEMEHGGSRLD
ncbi:MAG: DUF1801 domain-containing protein [Betaproteobacteria bacterium]|nr:MAG: DUF1801 domain-containing protein [Betaproteobacteria bacterium]